MPAIPSAIPSAPVSINLLVLLAYKRAGLLPVEARITGANMTPKLEHGRQTLDLIIDGLATEGFMARTMTTFDLPMVTGESAYTLPDNVLDVFEDAMFVPSDNPDTKYTTSELACRQVNFSTWQSLTTKGTSSARPTMYLAVRSGATVALKFWPVPSDPGTMRLKVVRLLAGNADGTKNADLQRYWYDYLVWELAHYLAVDGTMPSDKIGILQGMAAMKRAQCSSYSFEHVGTQATIDLPWSR